MFLLKFMKFSCFEVKNSIFRRIFRVQKRKKEWKFSGWCFQVSEIRQQSWTLIIFWLYKCRFPEMLVVEAVEGGLRSFPTLYIYYIRISKLFKWIYFAYKKYKSWNFFQFHATGRSIQVNFKAKKVIYY